MMEDIEKNIEAIEEEKKEYLVEHSKNPSDDEGQEEGEELENVDVDVTEISLSDVEIEEWITKLKLLQASKEPINLEIDNETELLINYDKDVEVEE